MQFRDRHEAARWTADFIVTRTRGEEKKINLTRDRPVRAISLIPISNFRYAALVLVEMKGVAGRGGDAGGNDNAKEKGRNRFIIPERTPR